MPDPRDAALYALVDELQAAQSDVEPFLARHVPEAVVVNFGGRRALGREALRTAMEAALASPLADVTTTAEVHDVRYLRDDVALVSCTKHVTDRRGPTPGTATGALTYVAVLGDGGWRVALAQTTPIASP